MNIKDYREKELKVFIIGNILLIMIMSGIINWDMITGDSVNGKSLLSEFLKALIAGELIFFYFIFFLHGI